MGGNRRSYSLAELAGKVNARLQGDGERMISGLASLHSAGPEEVSFLSNPRYRPQLAQTHAAAVIVDAATAADCPIDCLVHDDPYLAFALLSHFFDLAPTAASGVQKGAVVSSTATIADSASVAVNAVIMDNASLAENVVVGANTVIAAGTVVGAGTVIMPNVTIYHGVQIGNDCTIHSGAVIGSDGFGFAPVMAGRQGENSEGKPCWQKIAQLGSVRIGDRVEIGANTTIDRGALDDTIIHDDVIIDNQVQVAHNVIIGRGTAIAGCVGIAGSATIGQYCSIGGGAGISGHLSIADGTTVLGMTLINRSVNTPGIYASGTGMQEAASWRKSAVRFTQLERLNNKVKQLEKSLRALVGSSARPRDEDENDNSG